MAWHSFHAIVTQSSKTLRHYIFKLLFLLVGAVRRIERQIEMRMESDFLGSEMILRFVFEGTKYEVRINMRNSRFPFTYCYCFLA